ncbi:hypothetical protein TIFTF001_029537 [Ficus carica]|uniref:Uncharacterized protein n=1 Tax=Ficus carica TaxID=3494 RepID=A0AA88J3I8_FICCA|nr:hypothetical protein TIFTF001_029537 [Ficus carica]
MAPHGRFFILGEQGNVLRSTAGRRRLTAEAVRGGNLQLYPEEEQHYVGHNERGKYNSAYSIGPLLPDVSILPAISDAILWKAGAADCEMWDGHCHSF